MKLDLRRRRRRRRFAVLGLAFAVSLAVAAPATAKAPAFHQHACSDTATEVQSSPLAECEEGQTAVSTGGNLDETDAAMIAVGGSLLFVAVATGWLVSNRGKEAAARPPRQFGVAGSEP